MVFFEQHSKKHSSNWRKQLVVKDIQYGFMPFTYPPCLLRLHTTRAEVVAAHNPHLRLTTVNQTTSLRPRPSCYCSPDCLAYLVASLFKPLFFTMKLFAVFRFSAVLLGEIPQPCQFLCHPLELLGQLLPTAAITSATARPPLPSTNPPASSLPTINSSRLLFCVQLLSLFKEKSKNYNNSPWGKRGFLGGRFMT